MEQYLNPLKERLSSTLTKFGEEFSPDKSQLKFRVASHSNEAFPLRMYLTFRRSSQGEEVTIVVDLLKKVSEFELSSDACFESGELIAEGPSATIPADGTPIESIVDAWLSEFEQFLSTAEPKIRIALLRLN